MSSGYIGNAGDAAQELAQDHVDNLIHEARQYFTGIVLQDCEDCGDEIPQARVQALRHVGCTRCISCQEAFDKLPKRQVRMLDRVL